MRFFFILILLIIIIYPVNVVFSQDVNSYNDNLENWNHNIKLASDYLENAEKELKNGNEIDACIQQRKAADYGIKATNSLIKAFKESGSTEDLSNIEAGLNKWKELRDFC